MPRRTGGFIGHRGLQAPDPPTAVTPTAGDAQLSVAFTAPSDVGDDAITAFVATTNDGFGVTGSSSPLVITSLTNATDYTVRVFAINDYGTSAPSVASSTIAPVAAPRALFAGGGGANTIDYVTIGTTGNATDFGDLSVTPTNGGSGSSVTRAVFGGQNEDNARIDTVEINTTGNATDFGDLTQSRKYAAGLSNLTRAIFAMGKFQPGSPFSDVIDYITIASAGNATDFGDTLAAQYGGGSGAGSSTRGIFAGGQDTNNASSVTNVMQYVTIASTGDATDFGDLTLARRHPAAVSSSTRAVWGGGRNSSNANVDVMDYVTIGSTGNATDFGDLATGGANQNEGTGSSTRGLFGPSQLSGATVQVDYITIGTTGNSTTFGNLTSSDRYGASAASNDHGGLQ